MCERIKHYAALTISFTSKEQTMTKQDLIKHLAAHADVTNNQAEAVLNALTTAVLDTVRAGGELAISDLGKFGTTQRAAKTGRNPKTGATIQIAAKRAPKFSPSKALKDAAA
ncbi:HU family DNA-binding protein [Chromobacterium vaccinii]|uniref:HU family DNA-binding protein n=1 Tax=Chromobacterium vaccinii TaxID=1108595 RepID=UPI003C781579